MALQYNVDLADKVRKSKVLVVGAGGIGCELLKNLVLTGFHDIHVIDLDTIDVSNLNRQFLFQKKHVGRSKSEVAKESALLFNPAVKITSYHDSIFNPEYNVSYFGSFDLVMNALDNKAARNHVNRLCLAADIPLVESGTAGYLGQVTVIKKGLSECYECQPKPAAKTYPGCTIRNTPSEPIHCIVWAKHLFNQLFGEPDADQDVSPDTEDPELQGEVSQTAAEYPLSNRLSTRQWAESISYDPPRIFSKLFCDDIKYLLTMDKLWQQRSPPTPLDPSHLPEEAGNNGLAELQDQRIWTVRECTEVFTKSVKQLSEKCTKEGELEWDKDNKADMDFVTAAANLRCSIFGIQTKSRFDMKSMAGNIIPAIATTNAIIAGVIVIEALKILSGSIKHCRTTYLPRKPNPRKRLLVSCQLLPPNPQCYVCAEKPEVSVKLNTKSVTVKVLQDIVLKGSFGMVAPDVEIDDGKGTIVISSEEGETEENLPRTLCDFGISHGTRLKADDFLQNYQLIVNIHHSSDYLEDGVEFEVIGENPAESLGEGKGKDKMLPVAGIKRRTIDEREEREPKKKKKENNTSVGDDDDVMIVE